MPDRKLVVDRMEPGLISPDGSTVSVKFSDADRNSVELVLPLDGIEHLSRGILNLGFKAYDRQIETGKMPQSDPKAHLVVEGLRTHLAMPAGNVVVEL